jgi:hypothetical protein
LVLVAMDQLLLDGKQKMEVTVQTAFFQRLHLQVAG